MPRTESQRIWERNNPEKIKEYRRTYLERRAERDPGFKEREYDRNRQKYLERTRAWQTSPEAKASKYASNQQRRDWLRAGDLTALELREIYMADGGCCHYCGTPVVVLMRATQPNGFDHLVPLSKGGQNTKANIVTCCPTCNVRRKRPKTFDPS